jgi:glycosyltransferase involved in cell wall biosynthesis
MKLLVIVPAYNAQSFIKESISSILSQNILIQVVVIDDGSIDKTVSQIPKNSNINVIRNLKNMGTYYSINRALVSSASDPSWTHFTVHGADDVSLPGRFKAQLSKFSNGILAVGCGYNRVDHSTGKVMSTTLKTDESVLIFSRKVFESIGYYATHRVGSDTEYKKRLLLCHPKSISTVPRVLIKSYLHGENLTKKIPLGGSVRKKVVESFTSSHREMVKTKNYYQKFNP